MRLMEMCRKTAKWQNNVHTLIYYVTIDDLTDPETGAVQVLYGVGVTILESAETEIISGVTFCLKDVLYLSKLLSDHLVTPVTAGDVVIDWLYVN